MALFIFAGRGKLISFSSVYAELKKNLLFVSGSEIEKAPR